MDQDRAVATSLAKRIRQAFLTSNGNGVKKRSHDPEDRPPAFADALLSDPFDGEHVSTLDFLTREWEVIVAALEFYGAETKEGAGRAR